MLSVRRARPLSGVDGFADDLLAGPLAGVKADRFAATHPAGPVVLLRYLVEQQDGSVGQQVDALWVRNGAGWILGTRTPLGEAHQTGPVLAEIFQRFRPG